jgi:hypothetical protein
MWKLLIACLMAYFSPQVEGEVDLPDDEPPPGDEPTDEPDEPADEPADDEPEETVDEPEPPRVSRAQKTITELRARAQKAEDDARTAREEIAAARRATQQPARQSEDQVVWEQEEAALKDPALEPWQRYAIGANRAARQAQATSQNAIQRAEDLSDRTKFEQIGVTKPKLFEAYKDRVETMLTELRSRGNNAPREKLLAILVGEDMLNGKLKSSSAKPQTKGRVSTPGARSDVSSSGGRMTEAQKREKRLENMRI